MGKWAKNYEECLSFAKAVIEGCTGKEITLKKWEKSNKEPLYLGGCEYRGMYFSVLDFWWNSEPFNPKIFITEKPLSNENVFKNFHGQGVYQIPVEIKEGKFSLKRPDLRAKEGSDRRKIHEIKQKFFCNFFFKNQEPLKTKEFSVKDDSDIKEAVKIIGEYLKGLISVLAGEADLSNSAKTEERIKEALSNNPQIVLTGAPGTGKTYSARRYVAKQLGWDETKDLNDFLEGNPRFKFVQFHSGYDYTDFVQGYKPVIANNEMTFVLTDGIFKRFCDVANKDQENDYYFIIDEINRADLSRVFGELFFGLEKDYRGTPMITQYGSTMIIPKNIKIIGTMNDVDRGVETIDFALRRRFIWIEVEASSSEHLISDGEVKEKWKNLNEVIGKELGPEYEIGGSYFQGDMSEVDIIKYRVKPLLNEYLRGKSKKKEILLKFQDESGFDFGVKKETPESEE